MSFKTLSVLFLLGILNLVIIVENGKIGLPPLPMHQLILFFGGMVMTFGLPLSKKFKGIRSMMLGVMGISLIPGLELIEGERFEAIEDDVSSILTIIGLVFIIIGAYRFKPKDDWEN